MSRGQLLLDGIRGQTQLVLLGLGRQGEDLDRPNALDTGNLGQILARMVRLDLNRGTVEGRELTTNLELNLARVQEVVGLAVIDAVMVLDNVGALDNVGVGTIGGD